MHSSKRHLSDIFRPGKAFEATTRQKGPITWIKVKGEDCRESQNQLRSKFRQVHGSMVIDLSEFNVNSSSFIGLLAIAAKEKAKRGQKFILLKPTKRLLSFARLAELEDVFEIAEDERQIQE